MCDPDLKPAERRVFVQKHEHLGSHPNGYGGISTDSGLDGFFQQEHRVFSALYFAAAREGLTCGSQPPPRALIRRIVAARRWAWVRAAESSLVSKV